MGVVQAIKLMRSSISGQIPALPMAQVAVNLTDKILFVGYDGTTANVIKFVDMSGVASMISTATSELEPSDIDAAPIDHTMYVGTTALALNRAPASIALTGITSIDGSAAKLTTPRALTIGSTAKNFDGSAAVTWSLEDINTHLNTIAGLTTQGFLKRNATTWEIDTTAYLPIAGGTLTGTLTTMLLKPSAHATYDIGLTGTRYKDLYLSGDISAGGNVVIGGNLTVNGTTVTANVSTMLVEDPVITLGGTTAPTVADAFDRGIEFHWYSGSAKKGFFGFDMNTQKFTFIPDATNTNEVFSGAVGTIVANFEGALTGNASTATKVNNAVTFNNGGAGAASGTTFDGSTARAISYNTIGAAALAGSSSQDFNTDDLSVSGTLEVIGTSTLAGGVGITSGALTMSGKTNMETPYVDFRQGVSGTALSRIISLTSGELSIFGWQIQGVEQSGGKIKLKSDTYAEKALYIGGASGAKLVFVAASEGTPAYLKLQNYDGGVMHFVTTGGQTMYSEGVPAGGGGGSATVILNGETKDNPTFWAPIVAGTTTGQYIKWNDTTGIPEWGTLPTATPLVAGIMKLGASGGAATYGHGHTYASLSGKPTVVTNTVDGFMSSTDKKKLDHLYPVIYNAGSATGKTLADASGSIPDYLYNTRSMLLIFGDANEQYVYLWIATTNIVESNKDKPENWLRISKPDVDGGTY